LKGIFVAQWRRGAAAAVLLSLGVLLGGVAWAQAGPPSPTVQETPSLENETLAHIRYNNLYEIYGGPAFSHFNSGPSLIAGTNLGGFDVQGTRWLSGRLGATVNVRGYYGTQGVTPNDFNIHGPFVFEHQFLGGATYRAIKRGHAGLDFHALVGAAYGVFSSALNPGVSPPQLGMFNDGFALATAIGGSIDLNRSPRLALRISPDYLLTTFGSTRQDEFALSVGILYRFAKVRK
jgi:hypothetical protein